MHSGLLAGAGREGISTYTNLDASQDAWGLQSHLAPDSQQDSAPEPPLATLARRAPNPAAAQPAAPDSASRLMPPNSEGQSNEGKHEATALPGAGQHEAAAPPLEGAGQAAAAQAAQQQETGPGPELRGQQEQIACGINRHCTAFLSDTQENGRGHSNQSGSPARLAEAGEHEITSLPTTCGTLKSPWQRAGFPAVGSDAAGA